MNRTPLLRLEGLTRRFGSTLALDEVSLEVRAGEIHAILGENGAGKSTLMNLLYGVLTPDRGRILWQGREVEIGSPSDALRLGIGMVHQHFMLVPALTVWENVWLSHPDRPAWRLAAAQGRRLTRGLARRYGLDLDADARVDGLAVGALQRVEIAKALSRRVSLLILDEPTAVLAPSEIEALFDVLRELREAGTAVLFISHKLDEVLRVSDWITILRRGRCVESRAASGAEPGSLASRIVGAASLPAAPERAAPAPAGEKLLSVRGVSSRSGRIPLKDVSFELRAGEILGVTGVDGNGQDELVALLAGLDRPGSGTILLRDEDVTSLPVADRWKRGLSVLPGDRAREGLFPEAPLWENLALREFGARWARGRTGVDPGAHVGRAEELLRRYDVRGASGSAPARSLSGGNQQKLLLARELASDPPVLVLSNPTRGLDVAATRSLHETLAALRDEGRAILFFSTELEEVLALASRCAVMRAGEWFDAGSGDAQRIGELMVGATSS